MKLGEAHKDPQIIKSRTAKGERDLDTPDGPDTAAVEGALRAPMSLGADGRGGSTCPTPGKKIMIYEYTVVWPKNVIQRGCH